MTVNGEPAWTLADILAPLSVEDFMSEIYGKRHHHHRHGSPRFEKVLPWARAAELMAAGTVMPPRLILTKGERTIPAAAYGGLRGKWRAFSPDPLRLSDHLNDRATIAIHQVDTLFTTIAEIAADLEHRLNVSVIGEAYASFHEQHAFITHWDPADVIVLQVHGKKYWRVWEDTRRRPHEIDTVWPDAPEGDPIWEGTLEAGDILYLPHGFWHDVVATSEGPTLHVSFFLNKPSGIDLIKWLADEALDLDEFREELPVFADDEARRAHGRRLAELAANLWTDDVVTRFLDNRAGTAQPRPLINLPWDAYPANAPSGDVRLRGVPPLPVRIQDEGETLRVDALETTWRFAPEARGMLELVVDRQPHSLDEWYAASDGMPDDQVRAFIGELLREGLVQANTF